MSIRKCAECPTENERLYPLYDPDTGKTKMLCWNCFAQFYKDLAKSIRNGQKDLRVYSDKYKNVPKIILKENGEVKRG